MLNSFSERGQHMYLTVCTYWRRCRGHSFSITLAQMHLTVSYCTCLPGTNLLPVLMYTIHGLLRNRSPSVPSFLFPFRSSTDSIHSSLGRTLANPCTKPHPAPTRPYTRSHPSSQLWLTTLPSLQALTSQVASHEALHNTLIYHNQKQKHKSVGCMHIVHVKSPSI